MTVKHIKDGTSYADAKNCPLANAAKEIFGETFQKVLGQDQVQTTKGVFTIVPKYTLADYHSDRANVHNMGEDHISVRNFQII